MSRRRRYRRARPKQPGIELPRKFNARAHWRRMARRPHLSLKGRKVGARARASSGTSKAEVLAQARKETGNPRLTWKAARKYEKRLKHERGTVYDTKRKVYHKGPRTWTAKQAKERTSWTSWLFFGMGGRLGRGSSQRKPKAFRGGK